MLYVDARGAHGGGPVRVFVVGFLDRLKIPMMPALISYPWPRLQAARPFIHRTHVSTIHTSSDNEMR